MKWIILLILILASIQDAKTKSVYAAFPIAIISLGIISLVTSKSQENVGMIIALALGFVMFSFITRESLGLGDSLTLAGLTIMYGVRGVIFIISSMSLCLMLSFPVMCLVSKGCRNVKAIPLIPYITCGYTVFLIMLL